VWRPLGGNLGGGGEVVVEAMMGVQLPCESAPLIIKDVFLLRDDSEETIKRAREKK